MSSDRTFGGDFSKSMDQLCYQLSYSNVKISPFTNYANVHDFINEFELATAGLNDSQRLTLLAKGFPPGRYRSWYENDLKPIVGQKSSWTVVRSKLLERFSVVKDQDRHFKRLRELSFNPEKDQTLTEFIDEVIYSFNKIHGEEGKIDHLIRHVKASLPSEVITALSVYSDFQPPRNSLRKPSVSTMPTSPRLN